MRFLGVIIKAVSRVFNEILALGVGFPAFVLDWKCFKRENHVTSGGGHFDPVKMQQRIIRR